MCLYNERFSGENEIYADSGRLIRVAICCNANS